MNRGAEEPAQPKAVPRPAEKQVVPLGAKLTGNKEADDDIMAFYKAKEELLKRKNEAKV